MLLFSAPVSISFFVSLVPASNLRISHLFYGIVCDSFYLFDPIFFFNLCSVDLFVIVVLERHVAVHLETLERVALPLQVL